MKRKNYTSEDLQLVQGYEDQVNEVIMILEANNDIMKSLSEFYDKLMSNDAFDAALKVQCKEDVREFVAQIGDMMYDANMQIRRAKLLVKITADRKALVCDMPSYRDEQWTDSDTGSPTPPRTSDGSYIKLDIYVVQRSHHYAYHYYCYTYLSSRYLRIGKQAHLNP